MIRKDISRAGKDRRQINTHQSSQAGYHLAFPYELTRSLNLKAGDEFILKPLTSPLGKQAMKWALEVQRKKK